ncbi:putative tail lysin 2 [Bacillus phage phiAGATE]|uniref:Tail lysin 2 n=1 Tax=Bacillus phage phiAGATE TaxID=1204533 RepID=L0LA71_9CAUD|nr:tail associated lysin [Bacillus phage phiAGATE]AGB62592.1 putative tail lysin 2 [Bacillus phage phiAGATE]
MANVEQYIFNVDAETSKAVAKLQELEKHMQTIEDIRNKGVDSYSTTTQKDMDKSLRSMSQLTRMYRNMSGDLNQLKQKMRDMSSSIQIPKGATEQQRQEINKLKQAMDDQSRNAIMQQRQLQREYEKTLARHRETVSFQQKSSKDFKHIFNSNDVYNLPSGAENFDRAKRVMQQMAQDTDGVTSKVKDLKTQIQEVMKLDRRSESLSRRAEASNYMSHQQASNFKKDYFTATQDYTRQREQNLNEMTKIGQKRTDISSQIKDIENNPAATQAEIDKKVALQQTIEALDKEREARMEFDRVLNRTTENMKQYNQRVSKNGGVEVKPDRGTALGMAYERAPALGFAMTGAVGAVAGGLYMQGASLNKGMRDDVIGMGSHAGLEGDQWRSQIRDAALEGGLQDKLGFTGQEMLQFQGGYMSANGFSNMDDLNSAMVNQARFSRSAGIDAQTTGDFFSSMFKTGAVSGNQVKDIQDGFIGAIKQSGMEGREKDQLKALQGLLGSVSNGRALNNQDVMNVMGMQSMLAGTGVRSLQGEQGGQLLTNMNEGLRQGVNNPQLRLLMGQGTKYQGLSGSWELRERMEKGISNPDNIRDLAAAAESVTTDESGQNEAFARIVQSQLGVDITSSQTEGLMGLYRNGSLTKENLQGVLEGNKGVGAEAGADKLDQYQKSHEATDNQSDATTQKQATQLYDYGEVLRKANASMSGFNAATYAGILAMGAFTVAAATAAASLGGSALLRKGVGALSGRFGRGQHATGGPGGATTFAAGTGGRPGGGGGVAAGTGAAGTGGIVGADGRPISSAATAAAEGASGGSKGILGKIGGWFGGGGAASGAVEGAATGASGGMLSKAGSFLSKAALPIGIATGVGSIVMAPEDKKGEATGAAAGGILGGIGAGAAAGAALGSIVPGVGNIVGGIGGGIVGGIAGSSLGGWIGGMFDGGKNETAAAATQTNETTSKTQEATVKNQLDKENTNTKDRAETKRTDNIAQERENLKIYENLLSRAEAMLNQARLQNGIFGSNTSNDATGTVAAGPLEGNSNSEKIWNFFSDKGFKPSAIAGIMGNLQQESGLDPTAKNSSSGAFGVGQWLGGRKKNLHDFAKKGGMDVNSLDTQLQFMWKEMNGGESTFKSILNRNGGMDALKGANVSNATELFEKAFERSGGSAMPKRQKYAQDFYDKFGSTQYKDNSKSRAATATASSSKLQVNSNINVSVSGNESVAEKVKNSSELKKIGQAVQARVYSSANFYSKETKRA